MALCVVAGLALMTTSGPAITVKAGAGLAITAPSPRSLPPSITWHWPLSGKAVVVHAFDPPDKPWLRGHRGVDLLASNGAQILAPTSAVVSFSGVVVDRPVLVLATPAGLLITLEPVTSNLSVGDAVSRGEPVGNIASPTHCDSAPPGTNSCLHWGVRNGESYLNPLMFVLDLRPSVLLPLDSLSTG